MPGLTEGLTHKIGPLPVWGWAGIGAVGVFMLTRGGQGGSSAAQGQIATGDPSMAYGQAYSQGNTGDPYTSIQLNQLQQDVQNMHDAQSANFQSLQQQQANTQYGQWWNTQLFAGAAPEWKPPFPLAYGVTDPHTQPTGNQSPRYYGNVVGGETIPGNDIYSNAQLPSYWYSPRLPNLGSEGIYNIYGNAYPSNTHPYVANSGWYNGMYNATAGMVGF